MLKLKKLKDDVRTISDELERARTEARQAQEDKRELEYRSRAIAGLWK